MNDGLFWTARMINNKIQFFRSETYTKNAEIYQDGSIPFKFLYVENNEVKELSSDEKNRLLAEEAQMEAAALTAKQMAAEIEAEAAFQRNTDRYIIENQYILLCDLLSNTPEAHIKLGLSELQTILVQMLPTKPLQQNAIFQYLISLQIALQRLVGIYWWEVCKWNDYPNIIAESISKHNAIISQLPES